MSEMAKNARAAMKAKATRMGGKGDPKAKVDASSWSPPEMMNTGAKVGMRPLSRRAFRKGGKVIEKCEGGPAAMRADRKQRKAGGRATSLVTDMINRNVKKANKYREGGDAHVGGYKSGGRPRKAGGGSNVGDADIPVMQIDNMGASPAEAAINRAPKTRFLSPRDVSDSPSMRGRVAAPYGGKGDWKRGGTVNDAAQDKKLVKKAFRQHDEHMHGGKHEDIKLKKGGRTKKQGGGGMDPDSLTRQALMGPGQQASTMLGPRQREGKEIYAPAPVKPASSARDLEPNYRKGGRTKKQVGGGMDKKAIPGDAPTRGYGPGKSSTDNYEDMPPPREHIYEDMPPRGPKYESIDALIKDKGIGKKSGGGTYYGGTRPTGGRMPKAAGGRNTGDSPRPAREIFDEMYAKKRSEDEAELRSPEGEKGRQARNAMMLAKMRQGRKAGGRMPKADGGKMVPLSRRQREIAEDVKNSTRPADDSMKTLKRARGGRAKGKTNISITINPQRPQDQQAMLPKMPTPPPMPPPPIAPPGMGPGMPPMPMPPPGGMPPGLGGPPPGMPPMPRKRGGRAYRSYKDMDAGALGGMGRLEKVEIEHGKRVGRLSGGRARSYKDMDAGSLGGMGRIEKIAIQKHKR